MFIGEKAWGRMSPPVLYVVWFGYLSPICRGWSHIFFLQSAVFRSRIRSRRIHKFVDVQDPDPLVRDLDPDPPIIKQK